MKNKIDLSLIEPRTFLLAIIFSFIWGFKEQLEPILPVIMYDLYGYTSVETGLAITFLNGAWCILMVLIFIAFFYVCNRNLITKIGSTLISAVIGNTVGFWAGYLISAYCIMCLVPTLDLAPFASVSAILVEEVGKLLLYEFVAIASAFIVKEWNMKLEQAGFTVKDLKKPGKVLVAFVTFVVIGIISLILAFVFAVFDHLINESVAKLRIFIVSAFLVNGAVALAVGYGLYAGKRWGWLFAFISSAAGILMSISLMIAYTQRVISGLAEPWTLIGAIIALLLNLIILACLLPADTRKYFRFLNLERSQD